MLNRPEYTPRNTEDMTTDITHIKMHISPLKHEAHPNKNSVPTFPKVQRVSITYIRLSVLFREIITVYSENHTKPINTLYGQNAEFVLNVKEGWYK
jgi:hypothetical protein